MERWSNGVLEYWSGGVMEYWSNGMMEIWDIGTFYMVFPLYPFPFPSLQHSLSKGV